MSRKQKDAAVAQSVVRRIGSAEVTGPIPVSSSARKERKPLIYKGFRFFYSLLAIQSSCAIMKQFGRGHSSAGRALRSQRKGRGFESRCLHDRESLENIGFSFVFKAFLCF